MKIENLIVFQKVDIKLLILEYLIKEDRLYIVVNSILEDKEISSYIELFLNLNTYFFNNNENKIKI